VFPALWKEIENLAPEVFFGGDVRTYHRLAIEPSTPLGELIDRIRTMEYSSSTSGYVTEEAICYHREEEHGLRNDRSRAFIYWAELDVAVEEYPSSFAVLQFMQDPCRRALFVWRNSALYCEKTDQSDRLCIELDAIWDHEYMALQVMENLQKEEGEVKLLPLLMKTYEEMVSGLPAEIWDAWESFYLHLMEKRLRLHVHVFAR
jgi:hypothetical protein